MQLPVEVHVLHHLVAEGAQGAAAVAQMDAAGAGDEPVGHARREAAHQVVLPVLSPAVDHVVPLVQLGQQGGDVGRVVLAVGVEGDDDATAGVVEAGGESGRLAVVAPEANGDDARVGRGQCLQAGEAAVAAAVVDEQDFVVEPRVVERGANLGRQRGQVVFLVIDGDDEAEVFVGHV